MAIDPSWIKAGSDIIGAMVAPKPAAPKVSTNSLALNQNFDFSGYTVATGSGKSYGATITKTQSTDSGQPTQDYTGASAGSGGFSPMLALALGAGAIAFVMLT